MIQHQPAPDDRVPARNLLGEELIPCSLEPLTGFYRDGCCETGPSDMGSHTVCCVMTAEFLAFSRQRGNDLTTPRPEYQFPGLRPGDRWCVCASRWREAFDSGVAPGVVIEATHERALAVASLEEFQSHAVD